MTHSVLFRGVATPLAKIAVGASRIAGPPDLPAGVDWPHGPNRLRLPMVLQLALADIAKFPAAKQLPRGGTLYFFAAQLVQWRSPGEINEIPAAIVYAKPGAKLVRAGLPAEADDEDYWDRTEVARCEKFRAHVSDCEADEPSDDDTHVVLPVKKYSSAFGETPPAGMVPLLEMRSDYDIGMNWGDAAWATWIVSEADLKRSRFESAIANVWIG